LTRDTDCIRCFSEKPYAKVVNIINDIQKQVKLSKVISTTSKNHKVLVLFSIPKSNAVQVVVNQRIAINLHFTNLIHIQRKES